MVQNGGGPIDLMRGLDAVANMRFGSGVLGRFGSVLAVTQVVLVDRDSPVPQRCVGHASSGLDYGRPCGPLSRGRLGLLSTHPNLYRKLSPEIQRLIEALPKSRS